MQETIKQEGLVYIEPDIKFDDLAANFELFDDWEDRYRYIIDLDPALVPADGFDVVAMDFLLGRLEERFACDQQRVADHIQDRPAPPGVDRT